MHSAFVRCLQMRPRSQRHEFPGVAFEGRDDPLAVLLFGLAQLLFLCTIGIACRVGCRLVGVSVHSQPIQPRRPFPRRSGQGASAFLLILFLLAMVFLVVMFIKNLCRQTSRLSIRWRRAVAFGLGLATAMTILTVQSHQSFVVTSSSRLLSLSGFVVAFGGMHVPRTVGVASTLLFLSFLAGDGCGPHVVVVAVVVVAFVVCSAGRKTLIRFVVAAVVPMCLIHVFISLITNAPTRRMMEKRHAYYDTRGDLGLAKRIDVLAIGILLGLGAGYATTRLAKHPNFPKLLVTLTSCSGAFMITASFVLTNRSRFVHSHGVIFFSVWAIAVLVQTMFMSPSMLILGST
ncbi:Aste57867_12095 [Aphanomyces stellatus]|uniref:Aste57867_12095 protein n=1 Tax=Aphanomyces stellatus TaxID=120398 RepID=A0A485KUM0_9STRA|nr:hypothetical protein As57867_012050 [Aphanomyces stellatus]VFT88950.1 Aste57867_12095 [Aphanomyces stellatus]